MRKGEVWFVEFPLEEDASRIINRPVIVLDENVLFRHQLPEFHKWKFP